MNFHIVSIGISKHQISTANLSYAADDAKEFYDLYQRNLNDIVYSKLLIDSEATLSQIRTAMGTELIESVKKEDAFLFFFSGHGVVADDPDSSEGSGIHYIVPFDATYDFESSCIPISYIRDIIHKLESNKILVFIDSCFSGGATKYTKGMPQLKKKIFKEIKTIQDLLPGTGNLTITASKADEEAIEDPELKRGLFTHFLIEELQKERSADEFAIIDIFTPLCDKVVRRAKDNYNHDQTPTLGGQLEGNLLLPRFVQKTSVTPDLISLPPNPELSNQVYSPPTISIDDKELEKIINEVSDIIINDVKNPDDPRYFLKFEKLVNIQFDKIRVEWENIIRDLGGSNSNIPEAITRLEFASFSFFVTAGVVANFGSEKQIKIIGEICGAIINLGKRMAGLVAFLTIPELIIAEIVYIVAIITISRKRLSIFKSLMDTKVADLDNIREEPRALVKHYYVHYCDALGSYANKVSEHITKFFIQHSKWLNEITPKVKTNLNDLILQANLLIVLYTLHNGEYLWPNFARYFSNRLIPFLHLYKYDDEFRKQIIFLFNSSETDIDTKIKEYMDSLVNKGIGNYTWDSIHPEDFFRNRKT